MKADLMFAFPPLAEPAFPVVTDWPALLASARVGDRVVTRVNAGPVKAGTITRIAPAVGLVFVGSLSYGATMWTRRLAPMSPEWSAYFDRKARLLTVRAALARLATALEPMGGRVADVPSEALGALERALEIAAGEVRPLGMAAPVPPMDVQLPNRAEVKP